MDKMDLLRRAKKLFPVQLKWLHYLHRNPELANAEFATTKFIKDELGGYHLDFLPLKMKTGAAIIINRNANKAVALRADIDALPIEEKTGLSYRSIYPGRMHACGHDVHTAIAMGVAVILQEIKESIPGAVKILFQPAEESPPGGAEKLIKEGILKGPEVKMIFALHTDPTLATGRIALTDGPAMASVTDFDITIFGKGSHAAKPHLGTDALVIGAEIINALQIIVSRDTNPLEPLLITIGMVNGGTARNVIADKLTITGTARTLYPETRKKFPSILRRTVDGICRSRGAKYQIDMGNGYPPLINHADANKIIAASYGELFGPSKINVAEKSLGGEDFSLFLEKIPGAMFRLGVKNNKIGANKPWHSSQFIADPEGIYYGTAQMVGTVLTYFEKIQV
jgi:amidohydrolase